LWSKSNKVNTWGKYLAGISWKVFTVTLVMLFEMRAERIPVPTTSHCIGLDTKYKLGYPLKYGNKTTVRSNQESGEG